MPTLSDAAIAGHLAHLPGWTREAQTIVRRFTFASFPAAVAFVNRLVPGAEAADHHPDLCIHYRCVTVTFSTHSEGELTLKDFAGAAAVDAEAHAAASEAGSAEEP